MSRTRARRPPQWVAHGLLRAGDIREAALADAPGVLLSAASPPSRGTARSLRADRERHRVLWVLVAATTLAVFVVDPRQPAFRPDLGWIVLAAYVGFSLLVFLLARRGYVKPEVRGWVVAADLGWIVVITLFTEGGATPFFLLGTFVISSVSVRWGLAVSAPITVLLALSYPGLILFAGHVIDAEAFPFARAHWFRPVYLLALGYLIAYLGEHERRS